MHFKLLLKQSFRDFINKIVLYLTFSFFLVLTISVSLGMISFSYGYINLYDQTFGHQRINASLWDTRYIPATIAKEDLNGLNLSRYYAVEEKNEHEEGTLESFLKTLDLSREENGAIPTDNDEWKRLLLGLGYLSGTVTGNLTQVDILQDDLLRKYFSEEGENKINEKWLTEFRENLFIVNKEVNLKYQTTNLVMAYLIQYFFDHPDEYYLGGYRVFHSDLEIQSGGQKERINWEYLKVNPEMGEIYDQSPKTLRINPTNPQKIWKKVDLNAAKYREYRDNYRYLYTTPSFLHTYNYKVGDVINLRFTGWDNNSAKRDEGNDFLIAGSLTTSELVNVAGFYESVVLPYPWIHQFWNEKANDDATEFQKIVAQPHVSYSRIYFNIIEHNGNLAAGQQAAAELFRHVLFNRTDETQLISNTTAWAEWISVYVYNFSQTLFLVLAYLIGFITLGLLFMVFYFITKQIIMMQQKTLFFLKSMGVRDSGLSLLTTLAMIPPLLIGLSFGVFGALAIQQMMYRIALDQQCFYMPYFSFNFVYFVALIGIIGFTFLAFYSLNIMLIKSKSLTIEGMGIVQANNRFFEKIKIKMVKVSPQLRIGFAFAFKNIYKNLISYFILSLTFGVILFGSQFNQSLDISAHAYEKWNLPYRSVLYADNLKVFAPTREAEDDLMADKYIRGYEPITNLQGLTKIDSDESLTEVIQLYLQNSLPQESLFQTNEQNESFNWKKYYVDKTYTLEKLELIADNEESKNEFIDQLIKRLGLEDDDRGIITINNFVNAVVNKYRSVRDEYDYHDGFTILFGQVFTPTNARSISAMRIAGSGWGWMDSGPPMMLSYAPDDFDTKKHFGFDEFKTDEDFIVDGTYQETDSNTNATFAKEGKLLKVNVSVYLASLLNLHRGDSISFRASGLKSVENEESSLIHAQVNKIINEDAVRPTLYTSQTGIIKYIIEDLKKPRITLFDSAKPKFANQTEELLIQQKAYEDLLAKLKDPDPEKSTNLNNTVFDRNEGLPIGGQYITMPFFHHTIDSDNDDPDNPPKLGSRIEDFYDEVALPKYFNEIGSNGMIFRLVTERALRTAAPFNDMMEKFIIILLVISFAVSSILITLVLLDNRKVILLFKAMGYKKSEVNWYLITGYFISAILATLTAMVLAYVALNATSSAIAQFLAIGVYFIWSWQFILFAFALAGAFCLAISFSIVIYTNIQEPRDAFAVL